MNYFKMNNLQFRLVMVKNCSMLWNYNFNTFTVFRLHYYKDSFYFYRMKKQYLIKENIIITILRLCPSHNLICWKRNQNKAQNTSLKLCYVGLYLFTMIIFSK